MMVASASGNAGAPTYGDLAEQWVTDRFGYEHVDQEWYDHVGAVRKIQVKATQVWIGDGYDPNGTHRRRRGRFRLWEHDHKRLLDDDAVYLFILYEIDEAMSEINVVHWKFVDPTDVVPNLPSGWWDESNTRRQSKGRSARLTWTHIIDKEAVDYE